MQKMMLAVCVILGLVMGPVFIQACDPALITPQCHTSSNCSDPSPLAIGPFAQCCNTTGRNSFRVNSVGPCIQCISKGCHSTNTLCGGEADLPEFETLEECCQNNATSFLDDFGRCTLCQSVCYVADGSGDGCTSTQTLTGLSFNQCCLNSEDNFYTGTTSGGACTSCNSVGCHNDGGCGGNPERPQINDIFSCCEATGGTGTFRDENGECFILPDIVGGEDPHFFLPLTNGDHLCFSIQGQPDFMFSLIQDKFVQLNALFVLPAKDDESETIANVSTFMGKLGLSLQCPLTGKITNIQVSAQDHSVSVAEAVAVVKNRPVTVKISKDSNISLVVDSNVQYDLKKDESAWLNIISDFGFGLQVRFYKKHLNMFLRNTDILTKKAHGLIGQFLTSSVEIDVKNNLMRLNSRQPVPVINAQAWPFLNIPRNCWYGANTDNQATGMIDGVYTDYIVEALFPQ